MNVHPSFSALLQAYFIDRLMTQCDASPNTIASHRDTFRLLLNFAQQSLKKTPTELTINDLNAPFVGRFLDHLQKERGNTAQSRNVRLGAIHSFFKYVALQEPSLNGLAQRVLAIPGKRHQSKLVDFLTRTEIDAVLAAPDQATWTGRRDRTLLLVAAQTGLRVSELIGLRCQDVVLGVGAHVYCVGKGRRQRCTPLRKDATGALRTWLRERKGQPGEVLFPNARNLPLSRDGVAYLLAKHVAVAARQCPSLRKKRVPEAASGFVLETRDARVLDVGTEFGVKVSPHQGTEVQVYQGSVLSTPKSLGGQTNSPQRVLAGSAARINPDAVEAIQSLPFAPDRFVRQLPEASAANKGLPPLSNQPRWDRIEIMPASQPVVVDGNLG